MKLCVRASLCAMMILGLIELSGCHTASPIGSAKVVLPTATMSLRQPVGIAVDPRGGLIVVDSGNHRLVRLSESGKVTATYGEYGERTGQFRRPLGAAVGRDTRIYVADYLNDRVAILTADGEPVDQWTTFGKGDRFNGPADVAIDGQDNVYIVEFNGCRVLRLDRHGKLLGTWGSQGHGRKQFYYPTRITIGPDSNIWITDAYNHRLKVYSPAGKLIRIIGEKGTAAGQFDVPGGATFDPAGNVWVADFFNSRIQRLTLTNHAPPGQVAVWSRRAAGVGPILHPTDLAFEARTGLLYVVDHGNNRLLKLTLSPSIKPWGREVFLSPRSDMVH